MIICKYKDGSSIRIYKTKQDREKAYTILNKMNYICLDMAHCSNHYSLKVIKPGSTIHNESITSVINLYTDFLSLLFKGAHNDKSESI